MGYGILNTIAANQCSICGVVNASMVIDHCHKTLVIRGAVCRGCNLRIAYLESGNFRETASHRKWLDRYGAEIDNHLASNLGPYPFYKDLRMKQIKAGRMAKKSH